MFPNLTVKQNLEFALPKNGDKKIVQELMELMELQALQKSKPQQLSGGQKQRVALARAIVRQPKILLLDEPLSSLNHEMRLKLQDELIKIHKQFNLTTIMVSHDIAEIYKLSDTIIKMDLGKIVQRTTHDKFFDKNQKIGTLQIKGDIIELMPNGDETIAKVFLGYSIIDITLTKSEIGKFKIGDQVIITSATFNPSLTKIETS